MKRSVAWFALAGLLALPVWGEEAPSAPEPQFALLGDVSQKVSYNTSSWDQFPSAAWSFTADLKPKFTYGLVRFQADSTWNLPLSASLTASAPTVSVSEAYFRLSPVDGLDLTFGQKRFSLGVGQTFTVGDSLNPVIGFFDQKTGFRGVTAEWSPVSWASLSGAYSTEGVGLDRPAGATQLSLLLDKLQLTASLAAQRDKSFNPAVGASYDLLGIIVTAEGAAEFLPQGQRPSGMYTTWSAPEAWTQPVFSGSAGARWTVTLFDVDFTVAGEYLHWGQGFTADETKAWKAALGGAGANTASSAKLATHGVRGQENAFVRLSAVSGSEYSLSSFAAIDLLDSSVLTQVAAVWAPWDNFEFDLTFQASSGDSGSSWEFVNANKDRVLVSLATVYHF